MVALPHFFTTRAGLHHIRQTGHSHWCHEAVPGSLSLRLTPLPYEASPGRVAPPYARLATCTMRNLHGELLSVHENSQAFPGAPDHTDFKSKILKISAVSQNTHHVTLFHSPFPIPHSPSSAIILPPHPPEAPQALRNPAHRRPGQSRRPADHRGPVRGKRPARPAPAH